MYPYKQYSLVNLNSDGLEEWRGGASNDNITGHKAFEDEER